MSVPFAAVAGFAANHAANSGMQLLGGAQRSITYAANLMLPNAPLQWDQYLQLWAMEFMSAELFGSESRQLGLNMGDRRARNFRIAKPLTEDKLTFNDFPFTHDTTAVEKAAWLAKNIPSPEEILLMMNRGLIDNRLAYIWMKLNFGGEGDVALKYMTLKDQIPGPTDLVSFAVRDCFSPDIVRTFEYNKELPTAILPWMKRQGLGGDTGLAMPPGSTTTEGDETRSKVAWFDLYWWSHWQLPSVGQGYEMLQRLYPISLYGPSPYANADTFFTTENLELLQKANDYPTFWRKRLQAVAYHPLGRIDIKRMYSVGILKEDDNNHEVFHAYRQIGYNDTDAQRLAQYVVKAALKDIQDLTVQEVDKFYKQGSLSVNQTMLHLEALHFTSQNAKFHIGNLDLQIKHDEIDKTLKFLRRAFMTGDATKDWVISQFNAMGLEVVAQERYIREWQLDLQTGLKHISIEKTLTAFKHGIIPEWSVRLRMQNLNYDQESVEVMIRMVKYEMAIILQKQLESIGKQIARQQDKAAKDQAKGQRDRQKASDKEAKETVKAQEKTAAEALKAYSDKNMVAWFKKGLISQDFIRSILKARGYQQAAIDDWVTAYASKP